MKKTTLTIAVVNWNDRAALRACLHALNRFPCACDAEILVIDNGSEDGSADMVGEEFPRIRLISNDGNLGFAGACNQAVDASKSEFILFLNSDIEVLPGALDRMVEDMAEDPGTGLIGGHLVDKKGATQKGFTVRRFPTPLALVFELLLIDKLFPNNGVTVKYRMLDRDYEKSGEVDQPAGACLMVRRTVFEKIGQMDTAFYPAWFEDVDFCLRARQSGCRIRFNHRARFIHRGGASLSVLSWQRFLPIYYRNLEHYCRKHFSPAAFRLIKTCVMIGMAKRMLWVSLLMLFGRPGKKVFLSAYAEVLKGSLSGWKNRSQSTS
jgi:GT2 family glycosyltransferase